MVQPTLEHGLLSVVVKQYGLRTLIGIGVSKSENPSTTRIKITRACRFLIVEVAEL